MITREQIQAGIEQGVVRFIVDPNMEQGTVCQIGEHWFYFGGETAEEENPNEFLKNADMDEVVSNIVETLQDIEKLDDYEYGYYEALLNETLCVGGGRDLDTLKNRDKRLESLWEEFADIPMDPDTERMEESFLDFPAGTPREDIWRWFDERHSKGVAYLLYRDGVDRKPEVAQLCYRKQLCEECMSETCIFNPAGVCMFPMVSGRAPRLGDDGCVDWCHKEG